MPTVRAGVKIAKPSIRLDLSHISPSIVRDKTPQPASSPTIVSDSLTTKLHSRHALMTTALHTDRQRPKPRPPTAQKISKTTMIGLRPILSERGAYKGADSASATINDDSCSVRRPLEVADSHHKPGIISHILLLDAKGVDHVVDVRENDRVSHPLG